MAALNAAVAAKAAEAVEEEKIEEPAPEPEKEIVFMEEEIQDEEVIDLNQEAEEELKFSLQEEKGLFKAPKMLLGARKAPEATEEAEEEINLLRDGEADPEWIAHLNTILNEAENYFKAGGSSNPKIIIDEFYPSSANVLRAGETLDYHVHWKLNVPNLWRDGDGETHQYYNEYIENTFTITLPAGLLLGDPPSGYSHTKTQVLDNGSLVDVSLNDNDLSKVHVYTITFPNEDVYTGDAAGEFELNIYIGNNGTSSSVNTYNFSPEMIKLDSSFIIIDENGDPIPVGSEGHYDPDGEPKKYTHEYVQTAQPISTQSPDDWGVKKTKVKAEINPNTNQVEFTWLVEVGLLEIDPATGQPTGAFIPEDRYNRTGRDWLESMSLQDYFDTQFSKDSTYVTGNVDGVTVQKYITDSELTDAYDIQNYSNFPIWDGDTNASTTSVPGGTYTRNDVTYKNLMMNYATVIDKNANGTPNQLTPKYTKYLVTVKYDVEAGWIAYFPETEGYKLTETNYAKITEKLSHWQNATTKTDHDEQECPLPSMGVRKLNITKRFTDYQNNTAN